MISEKINPQIIQDSEVKNKNKLSSGRVDINHLIARVRKEKNAENRTNLIFFSLIIILVLIVGIILSF